MKTAGGRAARPKPSGQGRWRRAETRAVEKWSAAAVTAAHRTRLTASSDALSRLRFPANPANPVFDSRVPEVFFNDKPTFG